MKKRIFGAVLAMALVFSFFTLFAVDASAASEMKASDECIAMIQDSEGFRAIPYWDYSQWTVGFGTECPTEHLDRYKKEGIPLDEAHALFAQHLSRFEAAVNKFIDKHGLTLSQQQFDALVSFTYNLGTSSLNKTSYTIVDAVLNAETENELIYAFSVYCMAGGEFQSGLMRRRLSEANLYLNGVYSSYPPDSYCYIYYNANGGVRDASAQGYDSNLAAVPMSRPTKEGYTFVGWYTKAEGGVKVTSLDETHNGMTLYAHWEEGVTQSETPTVPAEGINVKVTRTVVHLRSGPGQSYGITDDVYAGEILTITGTTEANGELWGQCSKGWICLKYTNYYDIVTPEPEEETKELLQLPAYATVVDSGGITVYSGPHTTYPQLKTLSEGEVILLEAYMEFDNYEWVRYEGGWVRLNSKLLVHDERTLAHTFTVTTTENLVVRSEAGTANSKVTTLSKNTAAKVYAVACLDGVYWGRVAKGWVNLTYSDFDAAKLPQYQDHSFGDWHTAVAATCITNGTERRDCQYCDHSESRETELGDHCFDSWQVTAQPTCTVDGQEQRTCTLCAHVETRAISAAGHTMTAWTVIQEATCTDSGQEQRSCEVCGQVETREITPQGHSYGAWYETKTPTAQESGEERRDCQVCGYSETRVLAPTEHTFGEWYVTKEATCLTTGLQRRDCQTCDHYEEREVEALGHSLGQWYVAAPPTCTVPGEERRDCQHCSHYESRSLEATGHSYGDWYESIAPTYEEYGQERRDCANCESFETRQTDKLPIPSIIRTYATVTCDALRIRSGAGTGYSRVGKLIKGARVEILEIKTVGSNEWGRIEEGWICLTGFTTLETVEEGPHTTHTYGDWYETIAPTTTSCGEERRDCTVCGHYETQEIPMLEVDLVTKVYATITCDSLSIRSGAGTSYGRVGKLLKGTRVEILEQVTKKGVVWGRTATGWIWLSGYTTLETVTEEANPETVTMTVTADTLKIRSGAGFGNGVCGYLYEDTVVKVYETVTVDGTVWARIAEGWVCADFLK